MWTGISIIVVSVFFMVFFQKNIRTLIDRIKEVSRSGIRTSEPPSQEPVDMTASSTEKLMKELDSPVLREQEDLINNTLNKLGVKQGTEKEKLLIRYLAATHLALVFEQIYSTIWGSQIYILEHLNEQRQGVTKGDFKTLYYDDAVKKWPNIFVGYSYDAYIDFLKNSNLILEKNGYLLITIRGVEFLQYLTRTGRSGARFRSG